MHMNATDETIYRRIRIDRKYLPTWNKLSPVQRKWVVTHCKVIRHQRAKLAHMDTALASQVFTSRPQ